MCFGNPLAVRSFFVWYQHELAERGYCPGNWKWLIPPMAAHTTASFSKLKDFATSNCTVNLNALSSQIVRLAHSPHTFS